MSSPIPIRQQQQGPNLGGRRRRKRRININVKQCMYGMSIVVFIGQCSLFYLHTIRQQQQHVVHHRHPSMEQFLKQKQTLEHVIDEHVTDTLHHSLLRNFQVQHDHDVVTQSKKQAVQPPQQQSIDVHEHQKKEGLSACLLVNDENPRLPEWLAYHYYILPLRSLIVAVDPASRSSPQSILDRYSSLMDVTIWNDTDYLPEKDGYGVPLHGACDPNDSIGQKGKDRNINNSNPKNEKHDCLWHHRKRQRYFIKQCMSTFQRQNKTWVLLIDVDEYITFNTIPGKKVEGEEEGVKNDDPALPLDVAPYGIPTLSEWKEHVYIIDSQTNRVRIEGTISGILNDTKKEYRDVYDNQKKKNGERITTGDIITQNKKDPYQGIHGVSYGNVVTDVFNNTYYLRDDFAFRELVEMPQAPGGVATLRNTSYIPNDGSSSSSTSTVTLVGTIYNDYMGGRKDGQRVEIQTNWKEAPIDAAAHKTQFGGHLMQSVDGQTYYVEREYALWPPHLTSEESMAVRRRLPTVGEGKTIQDVLDSEAKHLGTEYAQEVIGPCLSMPRLLYGSREDHNMTKDDEMIPDGFSTSDFVSLRYKWHAIKESRANKFQKTIVDVSRLSMHALEGEAENIHVPLKYYCREGPPRYSTSFFRVNHYLDSFEAYSYRNDARSSKRQCRECYDEKGVEAAAGMDNDMRPWLKSFVESAGPDKAKHLLAEAGNFVSLSNA